MNISKINLKGTNYDIKDKLVRDSIGIPESENNSLGIAPLDASGKVPSENLPTIPQLPDLSNGHQYVDLGLPSGTLWATMNVGATSETDYGNYYMYGKGSKTYDSADSPYSGTEDPLDLSKDTARVVWGGEWRMPTRVQMQELINNTTYQWVTNYKGSGINGGTFTATNGAVLFIPAAGFWYGGSQNSVGSYGLCWGSSPDGSSYACNLYFSNGRKGVYRNDRKGGFSVRPVIITSNTLHKVSVTGDYNDLSNKPILIQQLTISSNTSSICSITGSSNSGKEETIIYANSGSSDVTVTVPTIYITPDRAAIELTCSVGGYCEVSYLNIGGIIYARGI